jgi:hypothetical protein
MKRTFDNVDTFYKDAMINITQQLGSKLRALGIGLDELPELINNGDLVRLTSDQVDGIILEVYEYKGIRLIEVEWSNEGIKQRDINQDETTFKREE